jgi:hypothetical protein
MGEWKSHKSFLNLPVAEATTAELLLLMWNARLEAIFVVLFVRCVQLRFDGIP